MYDNGDILLFALSAWRLTSCRQFKQCFDELQRRSAGTAGYDPSETAFGHRWRALRELSALGHIDLELEPGSIKVHIAPPVLAALPGLGSPRAVLCGARSPNFTKDLSAEAHRAGVETLVGSQSSASPFAPTRVELRAEDATWIRRVADKVGAQYMETTPARLLAQVSISLSDYLQRVMWSNDRELNWFCEDYDTERLQFRAPRETRPDQRLSRYRDPRTTIWHYRLWQGTQSAEVDQDWGRYAVLAMTNQQVLQYSPETRNAFIPLGAPLPTLLARAFGLCSGYCPTLAEEVQSNTLGRHLRFIGVPPSVFNRVAAKLDQAALPTR
jgi:hypothetical protein